MSQFGPGRCGLNDELTIGTVLNATMILVMTSILSSSTGLYGNLATLEYHSAMIDSLG